MALITIAPVVLPHWQEADTGVQLRVYFNQSFTAQTGTLYVGSRCPFAVRASGAGFYAAYSCVVSEEGLTIPQVQLDSTTDSPDNPDATYSAMFWDVQTGQLIQSFGTFSEFSIGPGAANTTWADIFKQMAENSNA